MRTPILLLFFFLELTASAIGGIKWEETFNSLTPPPGWQVIDNDGSGSGLDLFQSIQLTNGPLLLSQTGMSFWSSNYQNANLAGVIDEWLVTPQLSVIYAGDSLYFWAGTMGGPFDDSLRVWVSTNGSQLSDFTHLLGWFKLDGPAGSWHRYGFDLSAFDSSDIYIGLNYYIRDGGPGGQHSDFMWLDHVQITGDPATINQPPTAFYLLNPQNGTLLHPANDTTILFRWSSSSDLNGDTLHYRLKILDNFPPLTFTGITDTNFALPWHGLLNYYSVYHWTASVTDGKSTVICPDTFLFITPPIENLAPLPFALLAPPDGDTVSVSDSLRFRWKKSVDPNSDTLNYRLRIFGGTLDSTFPATLDTSVCLADAGFLQVNLSYQWQVIAADSQFTTPSGQTWRLFTTPPTEVQPGQPPLQLQFALEQNYPNPFNPTTTIRFELPRAESVKMLVYNILGQKVKTLADRKFSPGSYRLKWNGMNDAGEQLASGIYLLHFKAGDFVQNRRMVLLK